MTPPDVLETGFDDPSLAAAEAADPLPKPDNKRDDSVADLIKRFERENIPPDYEEQVTGNMTAERLYVSTEANLATTPGGVSTNYLFKFQKVHKAQISSRIPSVAVRPKKRMDAVDPATGQPIVDPVAKKMLDDYSATMMALITHFFSQDEMKIKSVMDGAIQDIDTVGIVYLKLDWLENMSRDPVGASRPQDFQATLAKMKRLLALKQAGKCVEGDADWQEMKDTADTIHKQMEGELWRKMAFQGAMPQGQDPRQVRWEGGLPTEPQLVELPRYRGFVLRSIPPEDARRDWSIFRPEEFHLSSHFSYCTMMTEKKIREFYNIAEDVELLPSASEESRASSPNAHSGASNVDPANRDPVQAKKRGDRYTVWCRMDREANKHYHWIEGSDRFLREPETPEVITSNWFNVFPIMFNRVSGRFLPVSNTTLGKPLQEEINIVRTHKRQAKRAAYNRYVTAKDLFTKKEMDDLTNCRPNGFTEAQRPIEDIAKGIYKLPGEFNESVHSVIDERQELGSVLNQSQASQGMTKGGSDSATEAAIANQTSDAVSEDDKAVIEEAYRSIGVAMGEILTQALPEENAKAICGPGAFWPMIDREQLWAHLLVEVEAGSTGIPDQKKRLEQLRTLIDIGTASGLGTIPGGPMWNQAAVVKKGAEILDWRDDVSSLITLPPMPPLPPLPSAGGDPSIPGAAPTGGAPQIPGGVPPAAEMQQELNAPSAPPTLPMTSNAPLPPPAHGAG